MKLPVASTYVSDPEARYRVDGSHPEFGTGVLGYYTSAFAANRVAKFLRKEGATNVAVHPHNPNEPLGFNIHPLVEASLKGYV